MRRQDWPEAYKRSGDVYAMTHDLVMKKNRLYGENTVGVVVDAKTAVDIDDMADWLYAEYIYNTLYGK
jgi:N-acylneuraminate cytidylyltransferase